MTNGEAAALALAERQFGIVTGAQWLECNATQRTLDYRVKRGRLRRVFPGVFRVPGSPDTKQQRAMAATLYMGDGSAVSHLTAGQLLHLDRCKTDELHVSVLRSNRRRVGGALIVHRVLALPRQDRVVVDGLPCTSATRTIIDCAAALDDETLEVAFESARRMGLTAPRALARRAAALGTQSRSLKRLLSHQRDGERALQYRLEVKMARLFRSSGLPRPERQVPVGPFRIDFGYPVLVGVECEGFDYHGGRLAWKHDKQRLAWLEEQGWRVVCVTWDDVTQRPEQTLHRIAIALAERGG